MNIRYDRAAKERITVGISVFATEGANIWSSGINQNIAFLVMLLRQSSLVGRVVLLNGGNLDHLPDTLRFDALDGIPFVRPEEMTYELDLVIEMGAQLPLEWLRHVRALGAKIVAFFVGHPYADLAESTVFAKESGYVFNGAPWHEVWVLPHHLKANGPMLQTLARVPVKVVPHIWASTFIDGRIRELGEHGMQFGFKPERQGDVPRPWRLAIFEPNISVVKSAFVPMLVCEQAYRDEPASVAFMMVMNTLHMKDHPTFNRFAVNLDLTRDARASYEPRLDFVDGMTRHHMDAVVSHHWECGLNYLYYDALYGGYPLIHNSEYLLQSDVGFYYPDFNARLGGEKLLEAWRMDAPWWQAYAKQAKAFLKTLAPESFENVQAFERRIDTLRLAGEFS